MKEEEEKKGSDFDNPVNSLTHAGQIEDAKKKGCEIVYPKPNELFIDIDNLEDEDLLHENIARLRRYFTGDVYLDIRPSKSGGDRKHAIVTLPRPVKGDMERILLQACLGSDRVRELLSWARMETGATPYPTIFFEQRRDLVPSAVNDLPFPED